MVAGFFFYFCIPFPLTANAKYGPVLFVSMKKIWFCTGKMVVLNQKVLFSDADRKVNLVKVTQNKTRSFLL